MFAILMKSNHEVAIIDLGAVTMPALYMKEDHAMSVLYKNDLQELCYVAQVRPEIFIIEDENDFTNSEQTKRDD